MADLHDLDFHAHHSPAGAYATFTCGRHGAGGGMTICGTRPANHDLVIGWFEPDGTCHALPFYTGAVAPSADYVADSPAAAKTAHRRPLRDGLERVFGAADDTWRHGDFAFTVHTPAFALPDAERDEGALQEACLPVVAATLRLDNRRGTGERTLVFAIAPGTTCRLIPGVPGAHAVGWGTELGMAALDGPGVAAWVHWRENDWFAERRPYWLGSMCGVSCTVPAGEVRELRVVLGFCRPGIVTTGVEGRFWYTRAHPTLDAVLAAGVRRYPALRAAAEAQDRALAAAPLDAQQRFLWAHAQRSYWGNTQLLDVGGRPLWVVLEGEYGMINTFDLTVDMCFYELARNPWTVRNVLDQFVERYSYVDRLARPQAGAARASHEFTRDPRRLHELVPPPAERDLPGGISFCHDMGVNGAFTPAGYSSYEASGLIGCFSYMTAEQLLNWICTATSYVLTSGDHGWLERRRPVFTACLASLLNRDDPVPARRDGIVGLDSSRLEGGWEITTYDSLDPSLGQARNNLYMATKGWASFVGLARVFELLGDGAAALEARAGAERAAASIVGRLDAKLGYIPAVFEAGNTSAIIPAIEGLVFPLVWGLDEALAPHGPYGRLIATLGAHLRRVLAPGVCLFADGGWKLSSTSDNSWVSKIMICQHVAERVFGIRPAPASHAAHARWQQVGSRDWAMTDQCIAGEGKGSRYYPRCVSGDLWLHPKGALRGGDLAALRGVVG